MFTVGPPQKSIHILIKINVWAGLPSRDNQDPPANLFIIKYSYKDMLSIDIDDINQSIDKRVPKERWWW